MKQMHLEQFIVSFLYIKIDAYLRGLLIWHQRLHGVSCFVLNWHIYTLSCAEQYSESWRNDSIGLRLQNKSDLLLKSTKVQQEPPQRVTGPGIRQSCPKQQDLGAPPVQAQG